jgi:hypothetical protein
MGVYARLVRSWSNRVEQPGSSFEQFNRGKLQTRLRCLIRSDADQSGPGTGGPAGLSLPLGDAKVAG